MKIKSLAFIFFIISCELFAQEVRTIQPSIMVIPRAKEGQDLRTLIDESHDMRVAISEVQQGFNDRDYTTKDFVTLLKALLRDEAVTSDNQTEFRNRIFQNAGTDIIVEVDFSLNKSTSGNLVRIILSGNETDSGNALSNKTCESGRFYTDDVGNLSKRAIQSCIDEFLETMNNKFSLIVEDGKSVKIEFGFHQNSNLNMNSLIDSKNDRLKYLIEDWLTQNAYKNYVKISSTTNTKIAVEDFRYPLKNEKTNMNNTPSSVQRDIDRFLMSLNVNATIDYSNNTLYITIE